MKKHKSILLSLVIFSILILCSCNKTSPGSDTLDSSSTDVSSNITIQYIGNSCFYIVFADGTRLVTDPYGKSYVGSFGDFPDLTADVITISHSHSDHTGVSDVNCDNNNCLEEKDLESPKIVGDVTISAYAGKHVADMGPNTIFVYEENGYKIANLGETDYVDSQEAQDAIKDADVVLVYAGEYGTITNKDNFKNLDELGIKVMIPEHYSMNTSQIFYGEPTIDQIVNDVPDDFEIITQDEYVVKKTEDKTFVVLNKMQ